MKTRRTPNLATIALAWMVVFMTTAAEADDCARAAATKAMSATEATTAGKRFCRFKFILSLSKLRPSARKNCGLLHRFVQ